MGGRVSWLGKVLKPDPEAIAAAFGKLEKYLAPEADRAERRQVQQFAAYRWNGSDLSQDMVKDISSSGLYIVTEERWQPGTIVTLTLQREGPLDLDPSRRITTQARVIRCGPDGVGLSFLWSKDDPRSRRWEALLELLIDQTRPGEMQSLVRMVEAFAFLSRICPDGVDEIGEWVRTRASSHKVLNAVSLALKAVSILQRDDGGDRGELRVTPQVAVRILEIGSATDEEWLRGFWAGLLISSASAERSEEAKLEYVELFSQLTSIPVRVLTVVCTRANKVLSETGSVSADALSCDTGQLATTVGSRGPQIERDLAALTSLQLIEKRKVGNSPALLTSSETYLTPTRQALELFALCNGHRGSVQDFYFVNAEASQVAS
jgi:hypothetical protein